MGTMMSRFLLNAFLVVVLSAVMPMTNALAGGLSEDELQQVGLEISRPSINLEIDFKSDTADVTPDSLSALDKLGKALSDDELKGGVFMIAVYAEAIDDPKSRDLAERRAETIKQYLVSNFKIDTNHLLTSAIAGSPDRPNRVRIVNISAKPS
jgi:outer membrane protein OmpA-like peptidoglycan-associated protein